MRRKSAAAAAAVPADSSTGDDSTADTSDDGIYDYGYTSPSASSGGTGVSSSGQGIAYTDPSTGAVTTSGTATAFDPAPPDPSALGIPTAPPTTNAQWYQAAEAQMVAEGFDATTSATALGYYLAGHALTSDQYAIVQSAIGAEGNPPVKVPTPVVATPAGPPKASTTSTQPPPAVSLGVRKAYTKTTNLLTWQAVPRATEYRIYSNGAMVASTGTTTYYQIPISRHGAFHVYAMNGKVPGPASNNVTL